LRKRGRNFIGLCPFHQEKTPSFTVSEEKQIFHCFGCHAGGNVYKFLMEYKSISFVEAVQEIAESVGITLNVKDEEVSSAQSELEIYYEINVLAARFFSDNLLRSQTGEIARDYLVKRNIKPQTQKIFGLGYAPNGWDNFLSHATEKQIDLEAAKLIGLIDSKDNGKYYDKYRGRIMFPIFSPNGRVTAFGGRVFQGEENVAKYLNSPESSIYLKRKSLYGLYHSKDDIRNLPAGEDPDSFINQFGKDHFDEVLNTAKNFLEFQTSQYEAEGMFEDPITEAEAIRELVKSAAFVNDELKRNLLLKSISRKFNLREKLLE
ncbi:unnamed protein product, partial [Cyprideis torosa]